MWALLAIIADFLTSLPPGRVTLADRYAMKRKVRALRERERESRRRPANWSRS